MARMATIKLFEALYTDGIPSISELLIISGNSRRAVSIDVVSMARVTIEGRNLKYENGTPSSGTIEKLIFATDDGKPLEVMSDFKIDAGQIGGETFAEFAEFLVARVMINGAKYLGTNQIDLLQGSVSQDRVLGRGGDDTLSGGGGRDILTGGSGNDTFVFEIGNGKDTITDFDADGGVGFQDLIRRAFADVETTTKVGKDTVIDFGDGDVLTLRNIAPAQIGATDFFTF